MYFLLAKAYLNYLGKVLSTEYAKDNILIQTVTPDRVDTKMVDHMKNRWRNVSAKDFVASAIRTVGSETVTSGHLKHKMIRHFVMDILIWLLPDSAWTQAVFWLTRRSSNGDNKTIT